MIKLFRRRDPNAAIARALYDSAVAQARTAVFYTDLGVPDTLDGRFDLIVLHVVLLVRRLRGIPAPNDQMAQLVFDTLVSDMDRSLREMGAGDLGVPPKVKRMAQAYYGRQRAYETALDARDADALAAALRRNLYGTATPPGRDALMAMTAYVRDQDAQLATLPDRTLVHEGRQVFAAPPSGAETHDGVA